MEEGLITARERQDKVFELFKHLLHIKSGTVSISQTLQECQDVIELIYGKELESQTTFIGNPEEVAKAFCDAQICGLEHKEYNEGYRQGVEDYLRHLQGYINADNGD